MSHRDNTRYQGIKWCSHGINEKYCSKCQAEKEQKQAEKLEKSKKDQDKK